MGSFLPQGDSGSAIFFSYPDHPIILLFFFARLGKTKCADEPFFSWYLWVVTSLNTFLIQFSVPFSSDVHHKQLLTVAVRRWVDAEKLCHVKLMEGFQGFDELGSPTITVPPLDSTKYRLSGSTQTHNSHIPSSESLCSTICEVVLNPEGEKLIEPNNPDRFSGKIFSYTPKTSNSCKNPTTYVRLWLNEEAFSS